MESPVVSEKALDVVRSTLPAVAGLGPKFTGHFYRRLFDAHPDLQNVFNASNQREGRQQKALFSAVAAVAVALLDSGRLPLELLEGIHHKHCALGVQPGQYAVVGEHILGTIEDLLTPDPSVLAAWGELYEALAAVCVRRSEELYAEAAGAIGGWRGERDFVLTAKERKSATVSTFTFAPKDGQPVKEYLAGQYITLWLQGPGWEHRQPRHYTLCRASNGWDYTIAVKRLGLVSAYLHDALAEGAVVPLSPPFGIFHVRKADKMWTMDATVPVVLLSAGVGITPTLAMLESLMSEARPVLWLHGARSGEEHPFRDYLLGLGQSSPTNFTRRVWYSAPGPKDQQGADNASQFHYVGHMDLEDVRPLLPLGQPSAMYFICGPMSFMSAVVRQLLDLGVPRANIEVEVFGPADSVFPAK